MMVATMEIPLFTTAEREILRPHRVTPILDWAREHIRLTEGPEVRGDERPLWVPERFAPQMTVTEAIGDHRWSRVILMTSPQAFGKTQALAIPGLAHAIAERGVSACYVSSSLNLAVTQYKRKIEPAFRADEDLDALIPESRDEAGNRARHDFVNGTSLHCAGAESAGSLSGFTCPVIICDDVQAYPTQVEALGHPADVAFKRSESYPRSMTTQAAVGTASDVEAWLWRELQRSTLYMPFVPCPRCRTYQLLEFERLEFPDDVQGALQDTAMRCARPGCGHHFRFDDLEDMLAEYRWVSTPPGVDWILDPPAAGVWIEDIEQARTYPESERNTTVCGFWSNALYWPLGQTWGERAAEFLGARTDPDRLKDYLQHVLTKPHKPPPADVEALTPEQMAEGREEPGYRRGQVPSEANVVTLTADVHARFIYYVARAWEKTTGTSWLIDAGTLGVHGPRKGEVLSDSEYKTMLGHAIRKALNDLGQMATTGWEHLGHQVRISPTAVLIDGRYRPDAVGQMVKARNVILEERRWHMIFGKAERRGAGMIWPTKVHRTKYNHAYREINVDEGKLTLRDLLNLPGESSGSWRTYADAPLETYWRHMASEEYVEVVRSGQPLKVWRKRKNAGPNHWLDCEVYSVAAAICCKVCLPTSGQVPEQDAPVGGWFSNMRRSAPGARAR